MKQNNCLHSAAGAAGALALVLLLGARGLAAATTYYVSPSGNDTNAGTSAYPFRTLTYA